MRKLNFSESFKVISKIIDTFFTYPFRAKTLLFLGAISLLTQAIRPLNLKAPLQKAHSLSLVILIVISIVIFLLIIGIWLFSLLGKGGILLYLKDRFRSWQDVLNEKESPSPSTEGFSGSWEETANYLRRSQKYFTDILINRLAVGFLYFIVNLALVLIILVVIAIPIGIAFLLKGDLGKILGGISLVMAALLLILALIAFLLVGLALNAINNISLIKVVTEEAPGVRSISQAFEVLKEAPLFWVLVSLADVVLQFAIEFVLGVVLIPCGCIMALPAAGLMVASPDLGLPISITVYLISLIVFGVIALPFIGYKGALVSSLWYSSLLYSYSEEEEAVSGGSSNLSDMDFQASRPDQRGDVSGSEPIDF